MAVFPVPRHLARPPRASTDFIEWIAGLPGIVAGLADRWSLSVGEPFQPGGQCSWTARAAGPDGAEPVLKIGFRFPGGEERDEAAGLRVWGGNGAVRVQAACRASPSMRCWLNGACRVRRWARCCPSPSRTG